MYTLKGQKFGDTCPCHPCVLLNIPFQMYSPVAVVITSTLPGRLAFRCWSVAVGLCLHSAPRVRRLVRSGTDVWRGGLVLSQHFSSSQKRIIGAKARPHDFFQTKLGKSCLFTNLDLFTEALR